MTREQLLLSKTYQDKMAGVSTLISHNVMVSGHRTSVRLEKEMWIGIKDIARLERCSVHTLCSEIAQRKRPGTSLTAAIRVFIMCYFQAAATHEGHQQAGHGTGAQQASTVLHRLDNVPYYGLREFKQMPQQQTMPVPQASSGNRKTL